MYVVLYYLYQAKAVKLSALLIEYFLHKNSSDAFPSYYQLIIPAGHYLGYDFAETTDRWKTAVHVAAARVHAGELLE